MKIQGVPLSNGNNLRPVGETRQEKVSRVKLRQADSVQLTGGAKGGERADLSAPVEFPPRIERVEAARERVRNNAYSLPDLMETLANNIIERSSVGDTVREIETVRAAGEVRMDEVENGREKNAENYYDRPEIIRSTAGRLIDTLGADALIG